MVKVLSRETKNLESTILTSRAKAYQDVDLSFVNNVVNGDVYRKKELAAVKQAVKNLILTNHYEKPFKPLFGGNIRSQLFELAYADVKFDIEDNIIANIEAYEPRVRLITVTAEPFPDLNTLNVSLEFEIKNTSEQVSLTLNVSRVR